MAIFPTSFGTVLVFGAILCFCGPELCFANATSPESSNRDDSSAYRHSRDSSRWNHRSEPSGESDGDVVTLWEGLGSLSFRRAGSIVVRPSLDSAPAGGSAAGGAEGRRRLAPTGSESWDPSVLEQLEVVLFAVLSPLVLLNGQDMAEVIQGFNGLVVGGIGALFIKLTTLKEFDPLAIVDIFVTAMAGFTTATSGLQNPEVGVRVQGAVIFKMITSNIVESLYLGMMQDLGGCASVSAEVAPEFPRGVPVNCARRVKLPSGEVRGEQVAQWVIVLIEYGIAAVGAAISPWLALFICIFNSSSMGANMVITGVFRLVVLFGKWGGTSRERVDEMHKGLQGVNDVLFFVLLGLSFLWQLSRRLLRKKGGGQGPYSLWRFRVLEARGGPGGPSPATWACVSGVRLRFHKVDVELPEGCDTPPESGQAAWMMTFPTPVSLTDFAFVTAGEPSTIAEDPVSWILEASTDADPNQAKWVCVHAATRSGAVPRARNARTPWFKLAPSPAAEGAATTAAGCERAADSEAKPSPVPQLQAEGSHSAPPPDEGHAAAGAAGDVAPAEAGTPAGTGVAGAVAADAGASTPPPDSPVLSIREKLQQRLQLVLAPIMVLNHIIKELSDTTSGKDGKRLRALAIEALVELGWEEPVYRKQLEVTIRLLLRSTPVKPEVLQRIVKSANDEDLKMLADHAANQQFAEFAKQVREVLRKLEGNVPELAPPLKEVRAKLDAGLREFFMVRAAEVISAEFFKSQLRARMMLLTLQTVEMPDGKVLQQGHLPELLASTPGPKASDGAGADPDAAGELLKFLEQLASGRPYPGRSGDVGRMEAWLLEDLGAYKELIKAKFGRCGRFLVCLLPLLDLPPQLRRLRSQASFALAAFAADALGGRCRRQRLATAPIAALPSSSQNAPAAAAAASGDPPPPKAAWADVEAPAQRPATLQREEAHAAAPPAAAGAEEAHAAPPPAAAGAAAPRSDGIESRALQIACEEELSAKLGMTREQARRLTGLMDEAARRDIGATGNVDLLRVRLLADRHGVPFNQTKALERQTSLQKFRLEKELVRDMPAWNCREAAKKANNMTPASISARMSMPETARPPNPPDSREGVEALEETIKQLREESASMKKQVEELQAKLKELEARSPPESPESQLEEPELWTGFYVQGDKQTEMTFNSLAIKADGSIVGGGLDQVGEFTVEGTRTGSEVTFEKRYTGKHTLTYRGKLSGQQIDGTWEIGSSAGAFQLRRA